MIKLRTLLIAAGFAFAGSVASAATCDGPTRDITLDVAVGDACFASGDGNIGNGTEDWLALGYVEIDDTGDGAGPYTYLSGDTNSGTSGTITVSGDLSAYDSILIGLKTGDAQLSIDWAVFEIAGAGDYIWSVTGQQALSHTVLYGRMGEVPLPAAGFLLLGGLGALGFMRRRKG